MKCWKNNFKKTALKQGIKNKDNIKDIGYDGHTFKSTITAKGDYEVKLIIQDDILFDMSCTCSSKSPCAHEATALYFLEEFPEVLEDFKGDVLKIKKINVSNDLKVISKDQLVKFIKKEFRKNPKLKYDFIKHFSEESLIDKKAYEKKLKGILRRGKEPGFSHHGYYNLRSIGSDLKKFMKKDIQIIIEQGEYEFAFKLLNEIMDIFIDQIYWDENAWYDIAYYYREYCNYLLENNKLTDAERQHVLANTYHIDNIVF